MPSQQHIRQEITGRIVEALENDLLPWRRPWSLSSNVGRPANALSKRAYSGVNPLLLELHRLRYGLESKWWGTFRQWSDAGCMVKKRPAGVKAGEWGCNIVFCKRIEKTVERDGEQVEDSFFMLRTFTVFHVEQVEGELAERLQVHEEAATTDVPDFAPADELVEATGADIRHGGDRAFYSPSGDYIQMPPKHRFDPPGSYYESILHELSHWSEPRLGFGQEDRNYAFFELVAEIASCYLAAELGVPQGEGLNNHAAYMKGWLESMKNDASFIFSASTRASIVTDYLLSFVGKSSEAVNQPVALGA